MTRGGAHSIVMRLATCDPDFAIPGGEAVRETATIALPISPL
jgi:hypothetical protein